MIEYDMYEQWEQGTQPQGRTGRGGKSSGVAILVILVVALLLAIKIGSGSEFKGDAAGYLILVLWVILSVVLYLFYRLFKS